MKKTFGLIGGDRRQAELASLLQSEGRRVKAYGLEGWKDSLEAAAAADVVILPSCRCAAVKAC